MNEQIMEVQSGTPDAPAEPPKKAPKLPKPKKRRRWVRRLAVLAPVLLHGAYDFIASGDGSSWVFILFVAVMFLIASRMVRSLSKNDRYI